MLQNDPLIGSLIAHNPFENGPPPKFIRMEHYRYKFSKIGSEAAKKGHWWTRKKIGEYMPAVNYEQLRPILKNFEWV